MVLRLGASAVAYEEEAIGAGRLVIFDGFLRGRRRRVACNSRQSFPARTRSLIKLSAPPALQS